MALPEPYFKDKNFRLYLGDCLSLMKEIPENSIDMVFADPPYFLSNGSFTCQNGKMVSVKKGDWDMGRSLEDNFKFHEDWIKLCKRVLKPTGTLWVSGTYHSIYQCGYAIQKSGMKILNEISWFKPNASPNLSCRFFTASHESLIWARKEQKLPHHFDYNLVVNSDWPGDILKKQGFQMRSVWAINTPKPCEKTFGKHPTQKPRELLRRIILSSTRPGDLILDPFSGSSTTGIEAYNNGRYFVGIDIEDSYLQLSIKRFRETNENGK